MANITGMVRSFIISNERRTRKMITIIKIKTKQNGLYYLCRSEIRDNDIIVSHSYEQTLLSQGLCRKIAHPIITIKNPKAALQAIIMILATWLSSSAYCFQWSKA
jgi:hypothetical protein